LIFSNKLADSIWAKHEVEEEDLLQVVQDPNMMNDLEIMNLMMSYQNALGGMGGMMGGPGGPGGPGQEGGYGGP